MVDLSERFRAFFRDREFTTSHRLDHYLTEHLPRLVREHEIATEEAVRPIDQELRRHHEALDELEGWRATSVDRTEAIRRRIGRLEVRDGLGGK